LGSVHIDMGVQFLSSTISGAEMKQYEECKKFDAFVKGKKIASIKWWADCNEFSPTLIFTDGSSVDIICKSLRFDFHK